MTKLAILICTLPDRQVLLRRLLKELEEQIQGNNDVSVLVNYDSGQKTTGQKRNELIEEALRKKATVIAHHDDDDMPGATYVKRGLEFAESRLDCAELWGQIYFSGKKGNPFHHSLIHKKWWQDEKFYYRNPNHLNFLNLEKVADIRYPNITVGEDGQYSLKLAELDVLKTQMAIPEVIYHYYVGTPKHEL